MSRHTDLIDAVNDATTQHEHDVAYARLQGWREALEHVGRHWSFAEADNHSMARFGEDRQICCGVLLDWKPTTKGVRPFDEEQKRATFEEWSKGDEVPHMRLHWIGFRYDDEHSQAAWMAWLAGGAGAVERVAGLVPSATHDEMVGRNPDAWLHQVFNDDNEACGFVPVAAPLSKDDVPLYRADREPEVGINGLTEEETNATASVMGLVDPRATYPRPCNAPMCGGPGAPDCRCGERTTEEARVPPCQPSCEYEAMGYVKPAGGAKTPAAPAVSKWERRQGLRARGGWTWGNWLSCSEAEAQRVTGLQSWQVRQTGDCAACNGTGRVPYGVAPHGEGRSNG